MSDYPTTQEVQDRYVEGMEHDCYYDGDVKTTPDGLLEAERFRAWLAEVELAAAAKAYEQGRIDQKRAEELYSRYQRGELAEEEYARLMDTTNRRAEAYGQERKEQ